MKTSHALLQPPSDEKCVIQTSPIRIQIYAEYLTQCINLRSIDICFFKKLYHTYFKVKRKRKTYNAIGAKCERENEEKIQSRKNNFTSDDLDDDLLNVPRAQAAAAAPRAFFREFLILELATYFHSSSLALTRG